MGHVPFTSEQLCAIKRTGCEVLVAAAAGAGKTAVLAERCAFLVCDAPPGVQCEVDELLVLTFTEAAAAEMRSRIVDAIHQRSLLRPADVRLREQFTLADTAQISTVHSFCLWLIRRWFAELAIDPNAAVLSAEEASLLRHEAIDELFSALYAEGRAAEPPAGWENAPVDASNQGTPKPATVTLSQLSDSTVPLARRFLRLVDDYGLGGDREIASLVMRLDEFAGSLPDPDAWLRNAYMRPAYQPAEIVGEVLNELRTELEGQIESCQRFVDELRNGPPGQESYVERLEAYLDAMQLWRSLATVVSSGSEKTANSVQATGTLDLVRAAIAEFEFPNRRASALRPDSPPAVLSAREKAKETWELVRERLYRDRLLNRFGLFTAEDWVSGLRAIGPYVGTLIDLVASFRAAFRDRKKALHVLDFPDLERLAYRLLVGTDESHPRTAQVSEVATRLRARFKYVLVDEFQDINPLQEAIIRAVCQPHGESCANLFAVGDIKQSIYRFRLAEPHVFATRLRQLRADSSLGIPLFLQDNFRSRPEVLDAVNLVFRSLMSEEFGGIAYDAQAELRSGKTWESTVPFLPVELHVVERRLDGAESNDTNDDEFSSEKMTSEPGVLESMYPSRWEPIEREAFLIGRMMQQSIADAEPAKHFRDMVVLLRSAKVNAGRVAGILNAMGIPTASETGGELLNTVEIRDVMAALQVLDNPRQDIPLASVLRSGIFGEILGNDDLVRIRCHDRAIPFHRNVFLYAELGGDRQLSETLRTVVRRIDRFREQVRRRPVAEVLTDLYERHGYIAGVAGLPRGRQRQANLLRLHEFARNFGTFRKQGLHRFLRFIESLDERDLGVRAAGVASPADDAVRILTIHQSKGLEFPVVFLAGLGTQFNLRDRNSRMIFERRTGIGLRVVDRKQMIEYRSAAHVLAGLEIERTAREEELRVLYVAMTRAQKRLVMVGSVEAPDELVSLANQHAGRPPTRLAIKTAKTPLDWLIPALASTGRSTPLETARAEPSVVPVRVHDEAEILAWRLTDGEADSNLRLRQAVARLDALPTEEPTAADDPELDEVAARLQFVYPMAYATAVRSVRAAGEFKGTLDYTLDPENPTEPAKNRIDFTIPRSTGQRSRERAILTGTATHRVMQFLSFVDTMSRADVDAQLDQWQSAGKLARQEREAVDVDAVVWFLGTPLADAIRLAAKTYLREVPFVTPEPPSLFDRTLAWLSEDFVLVRGIVDGILPTVDGIEIVDFKTDAIDPAETDSRAAVYRPQMTMYARAIARLWQKPVRKAWLVFLGARQVVGLEPSAQWNISHRQ